MRTGPTFDNLNPKSKSNTVWSVDNMNFRLRRLRSYGWSTRAGFCTGTWPSPPSACPPARPPSCILCQGTVCPRSLFTYIQMDLATAGIYYDSQGSGYWYFFLENFDMAFLTFLDLTRWKSYKTGLLNILSWNNGYSEEANHCRSNR